MPQVFLFYIPFFVFFVLTLFTGNSSASTSLQNKALQDKDWFSSNPLDELDEPKDFFSRERLFNHENPSHKPKKKYTSLACSGSCPDSRFAFRSASRSASRSGSYWNKRKLQSKSKNRSKKERFRKTKDWNLVLGFSYLMRQLFSVSDGHSGTDKSLYGEVQTPHFLEIWMPLSTFPSLREVSKEYFFAPYFGYTLLGFLLFPRRDEDGGSKSSLTFFGFRVAGPLKERWQWTSGLGLQFYAIHGDGGKTLLNDGTASSEFYLASRTITSRNYYLSGGLRFEMHRQHYIQLNLHVFTPFYRLRRAYDLSFGWFFNLY